MEKPMFAFPMPRTYVNAYVENPCMEEAGNGISERVEWFRRKRNGKGGEYERMNVGDDLG